MAITYVIERGFLRTTLSGDFVVAEVIHYRKALLADAGYRAGMASLVDARTITSLPAPEQLRALAQDIGVRGTVLERARCAVVVGSDAAYGLMRMYTVYTESESSPVELRAFRDLTAATRWLLEAAG